MWAGIPTPPMCSTPSCGRDQECSWTDDLRKWPGKNYCGGRKILVKWLTKLFRKIIWDLLPVYNFDLTSNIPHRNTVVLFVVCKNQIWFQHLNNCFLQASIPVFSTENFFSLLSASKQRRHGLLAACVHEPDLHGTTSWGAEQILGGWWISLPRYSVRKHEQSTVWCLPLWNGWGGNMKFKYMYR